MGVALYSLDIPVLKHTNALLAFSKEQVKLTEETSCIRCGRCVEVCPMGLLPFELDRLIRAKSYEDAQKNNLMDCMECGSCVFACPAKRLIVQSIRLGKDAFGRASAK